MSERRGDQRCHLYEYGGENLLDSSLQAETGTADGVNEASKPLAMMERLNRVLSSPRQRLRDACVDR